MAIDDAISDLTAAITQASPSAVVRIKRRSADEASIRVYAPVDDEASIKAATQDTTLRLLTEEGLDIQVLVYDITTSLPPSE